MEQKVLYIVTISPHELLTLIDLFTTLSSGLAFFSLRTVSLLPVNALPRCFHE